MAMMIVSGYVVAVAPPGGALHRLAGKSAHPGGVPSRSSPRQHAVSLVGWAMSLIFGGMLVRSMARRSELRMDYRAAGAAAYLGLGATWALGISSSAAQLQANPASLPKAILAITGVIPLTETIFFWQSMRDGAHLRPVGHHRVLSAPSAGRL